MLIWKLCKTENQVATSFTLGIAWTLFL